jgi:hypothetical protein
MPPKKPGKKQPRTTATAAAGLKIRKGTFHGLDVIEAIKFLALVGNKNQSTVYGHRIILFAGLKSWLCNSSKPLRTRQAIAAAVAQRIAKSEKSRAWKTNNPRAAIVRFERSMRDFYEMVYEPMGGMAGIRQAYLDAPRLMKQRKASGIGIEVLVAAGSILDFYTREISQNGEGFNVPSIERAGMAALWLLNPDELRTKSKSMIWKYWAEHSRAMPFLYAASCVELRPGKTMLDGILAGKLTLREAEPHFSRWLGYTKFFTNSVLDKMSWRKSSKPKSKSKRFIDLDFIEAATPTLPDRDEKLRERLRQHLRTKSPSQKVVRHH